MEITLSISDTGEITVSTNGTDTPMQTLDEAVTSIKALAEEALAGAGGISQAEEPVIAEGVEPTPDQMSAAEEAGMMQGYKSKQKRML